MEEYPAIQDVRSAYVHILTPTNNLYAYQDINEQNFHLNEMDTF